MRYKILIVDDSYINRELLKEIVEVGALTDEIKVKMENSILEFKKIFLQNA